MKKKLFGIVFVQVILDFLYEKNKQEK